MTLPDGPENALPAVFRPPRRGPRGGEDRP